MTLSIETQKEKDKDFAKENDFKDIRLSSTNKF